jgi:hypothetical protein
METSRKPSDEPAPQVPPAENLFTPADVRSILCESGWLKPDIGADADPNMQLWLSRAAMLLGPRAPDRAELKRLLSAIFEYDAAVLLKESASQSVMSRSGAREVICELARLVLDGPEIDSDRFKEIIESMKSAVPYRSREMFHPVRLALAGRAGNGEMDRVILLLDSASKLDFCISVKGTRQRMLEFCTALD